MTLRFIKIQIAFAQIEDIDRVIYDSKSVLRISILVVMMKLLLRVQEYLALVNIVERTLLSRAVG